MRKTFYTMLIAAIMIGCGEDKDKEVQAPVTQVDISKIEVSQGEKRVEQEVVKHEEELAKDEKGFYYAYDEINEKDSDEYAKKTFTVVDAQKRVKNRVVDGKVAVRDKNHEASTPYQYVRIDLLKNALSKNFMVKCSACHDDYANGIIGPSLLKKDGDYIFEQMLKYRSDPSKNILMYELVKQMPEDELKSLAHEVAEFNKEIRAIKGLKDD